MTTPLSPTSKAVRIAAWESNWVSNDLAPVDVDVITAAVIRSIADQVVPADMPEGPDCCLSIIEEIRAELLTIANELESPYQ
jgi:hypothetical protein